MHEKDLSGHGTYPTRLASGTPETTPSTCPGQDEHNYGVENLQKA